MEEILPILAKDVKVGFAIGDDLIFEDFYKTKVFHKEPFKVSQVKIACSKS